MEKINLLYFCSDYQAGLTQAHTDQIIEINKCEDLSLFCVSSEIEQEPGLHERVKKENLDISIIKDLDVHSNFKSLALKIDSLIKEKGITHVNVHNNWQLALVSWVKYRNLVPKKFKIIYTIHGYRHNSPVKAIAAIAAIGSALLLTTDKVISMSEYVSKKFRLVGYKTEIVHYALTESNFNKERNQIATKKLTLMFPAQFRQGKQQEMILEAVKNYIAMTSDKEIRVILPGVGPKLDEMKKLAKDFGIDRNVEFPGKLPIAQIYDLFNNEVNIAVISSNVETFGRSIAEPFALGRCVISRPTGVALDIIKNGETGFLFKNSDELTRILVRLHDNPELIKKTGDAAFAMRGMFNKDYIMKKYLKVIQNA